jgi:inward rectifier potassium channel
MRGELKQQQRSMSHEPPPISVRAGKLEFLRKNSSARHWTDVYRTVLSLSWPRFAVLALLTYLGLNVLFAGAYMLGGECIAEMTRGSFSSAFFFSVQTLSTVGFGHLHPITLYGDLVTTVEIVVGMFYTAVVTGLIFVRFSRPQAKLEFSHTLVLSPYNGKPALQLRVANLQNQPMVEAEFRLMLIRRESILEEDEARRFYTLRLEYDHLIIFPSALTIRHIIDESSPLFGVTPEELQASEARFLSSIVCTDTIIQAPVHSQNDYGWRDVRFGHRFVEIYRELPDGRLEVDYGRLHGTEPVPASHS